MIYLDSAATSYYRPKEVAQAVAWAIGAMGNCGRGVYETALDSARVIFETRQLVDRLFDGYGPEQTAFTANSTESLNMAIKGLLKPGDLAVTTALEHNSVLRPLYQMEELGVKVTWVGCLGSPGSGRKESGQEGEGRPGMRQKGLLDMEAMRRAIKPGVKAVICTHSSNLTGNITDIRTIGKWCQEAGALFIVDASQTAGTFPISMKKDHIDVLCFTGHKGLMGPQGTGGICLREGLFFEPLISGGSGIMTYEKHHPLRMPTMLEAGTLNGHGIAGLRAALLWLEASGGVRAIREREESLAKLFYQRVKSIPGIRFYGDYQAYEDRQEEGSLEKGKKAGGEGTERTLERTTERTSERTTERTSERTTERTAEKPTERTAVVTLNLGDEDSGQVSGWLAEEKRIYTRSGGHCAPLMHKALGTEEQGAVRFSFSYFNTEEEVVEAALGVREWGE